MTELKQTAKTPGEKLTTGVAEPAVRHGCFHGGEVHAVVKSPPATMPASRKAALWRK